MKKHSFPISFIAAALLALPLPSYAITAAEAFADAPSRILPLIEPGTRLDMIDYFNAGSDRSSRNALYGNSRIISLTPAHITVKATAASTFEIVTLPAGKDTVLAVIHTVATPVPDSKVTLYTSGWDELGDKSFKSPDLEQWLAADAGKGARDEVEALLPFMLASCSYNEETGEFVFTNRTPEFLSEEVYEPIRPLLKSTLSYKWDGRRLTLDKR